MISNKFIVLIVASVDYQNTLKNQADAEAIGAPRNPCGMSGVKKE